MNKFLSHRLRPFRHKSFRYFFAAQSISLLGTWAHDLARAWIIIKLMGNATSLGSLLLAISIPSLIFSLQGGVIADRGNVRKIMMTTKSLLAVASLVLAIVVEYYDVKMWHLLVYGVFEGLVVAFDGPTFQALTVRMVPREEFQQAIALNSTNFHVARMLGPLVAGILMHWHGPSIVFLFDAISYVFVVFALSKVDLKHIPQVSKIAKSSTQALVDGMKYAFSEPRVRYVILQFLFSIALILPTMMVLFRTLLAHKFSLNSDEFGFLFMFPAFGAVLGALCFAAIQPKQPLRALQYGVPITALAILLLPRMPTETSSAVMMAFAGFGSYINLAGLTVSLHLGTQEEYRGRVSSIINLGFASLAPLMSFPIGVMGDKLGDEKAMYILSFVFAVCSAFLAYRNRILLRRLTGKLNSETF